MKVQFLGEPPVGRQPSLGDRKAKLDEHGGYAWERPHRDTYHDAKCAAAAYTKRPKQVLILMVTGNHDFTLLGEAHHQYLGLTNEPRTAAEWQMIPWR